MKFLLKIVYGPNAGAEIALVEGMNLTFGCGDDCDIILSDTSVGEKAFELEVTGERVVAVMPGGKTLKLEPYHVTAVGASAIAVGPQDGVWKSLVWPKMETASEKDDDAQVEADVQEEKPKVRRFPYGCIAAAMLLSAVAALAVFAWRRYPKETREYSRKVWDRSVEAWHGIAERFKEDSHGCVAAPEETLEAVARDCGFSVEVRDGATFAKGDFRTRVRRLEATARAYAAQPGLRVDFSDAESIACAVSELLLLVSDGELKLDRVEGRKAFLSGSTASRGTLEKALRALSEDVPKITAVDCSRVTVGAVAESAAAEDGGPAVNGGEASPLKRRQAAQRDDTPKMPIAGVLTVPYPCLVLNDGTRVMEGARFGEYSIEKISPDRITVRGAHGSFEWRP
jgi:hypothetical protein